MHVKNSVGGLALSLLMACGSAASEGLYDAPDEGDSNPRAGGDSERSVPPPATNTPAPGIDASSPDAGGASGAACDDEDDKPGKGKGKGPERSDC